MKKIPNWLLFGASFVLIDLIAFFPGSFLLFPYIMISLINIKILSFYFFLIPPENLFHSVDYMINFYPVAWLIILLSLFFIGSVTGFMFNLYKNKKNTDQSNLEMNIGEKNLSNSNSRAYTISTILSVYLIIVWLLAFLGMHTYLPSVVLLSGVWLIPIMLLAHIILLFSSVIRKNYIRAFISIFFIAICIYLGIHLF